MFFHKNNYRHKSVPTYLGTLKCIFKTDKHLPQCFFLHLKYFLLSTQDVSSVENSVLLIYLSVYLLTLNIQSVILKRTLASLGLKLCGVRTRCHCRIIVSIVESGILASVPS